MKRTIIVLTAIALAVLPATKFFAKANAQTRNQSYKVVATETFEFPNDCTNELMLVSDTTFVSCHDQQRDDGKFTEKCEIRQVVTALGETTGIVWQGEATFKDETVAVDPCNFSLSNLGTVHLISRGSAVNTMITFDDFVRVQDCAITDDQEITNFDCRGR